MLLEFVSCVLAGVLRVPLLSCRALPSGFCRAGRQRALAGCPLGAAKRAAHLEPPFGGCFCPWRCSVRGARLYGMHCLATDAVLSHGRPLLCVSSIVRAGCRCRMRRLTREHPLQLCRIKRRFFGHLVSPHPTWIVSDSHRSSAVQVLESMAVVSPNPHTISDFGISHTSKPTLTSYIGFVGPI